MKRIMMFCSALLLSGMVSAADETDMTKELNQLKKENREIMERLDAVTTILEQQQQGDNDNRVHIGGYGELHYNNLDNQLSGGDDKKELDFHRFVLFFSYDYSDSIRFVSEVELEHSLSGDGKPGEVELEQAYVEFDLNKNHSAKGGVFLVPVGILNETHEPPVFYGVERNPVENKIIPTTWWAAGAELTGRFADGFSYNIGLHEGLNLDSTGDFAVRSGRQKSAKADASDLAMTARIKYTGIPGLELAATLQHQGDVTQDSSDDADAAILLETHAVWQSGPYNLRALYATWDLDGSAPEANGADEQTGWFIEPAYRINARLGVFARYNEWDNQAGNATDSEYSQFDIGINYWPHQDVVVKADYQDQDAPGGSNEYDGINLGIGYQF